MKTPAPTVQSDKLVHDTNNNYRHYADIVTYLVTIFSIMYMYVVNVTPCCLRNYLRRTRKRYTFKIYFDVKSKHRILNV